MGYVKRGRAKIELGITREGSTVMRVLGWDRGEEGVGGRRVGPAREGSGGEGS